MENKFDKEIEDLGWEKMQALLDKEKPVVGIIPTPKSGLQKSQKSGKNSLMRKRWALAALLFLSLAGCGILSYNFFKLQPKTQQSLAIDNALKMKKNNTNLTENGLHTEGGKDDLTQSLTQNLDFDKENKGVLSENKDKIIEINLTDWSNALNALNEDDKTQNHGEKFVEKNVADNAYKIEERLMSEAFNPLIFEPIIDAVSSIVGRPIPIINLKENAYKMPYKWQFGLTLGAHTEGVRNLDGYQMGFIFRKKLNQKWALKWGLNYSKTTAQSHSNSNLLAASIGKSNSSISTPSASLDVSKDVEVKLKNIQYLELPILFNRQINSRFSISTGLKMSYLMSQNWRTIDTSNAHIYVISYGNQSFRDQAYSSSNTNLKSTLKSNALDFAILGGINYHISHHFDVSLRYDLGLKNIFKQSGASVYNRYLGLNLNYYFNYRPSSQF